MPAAAVRRLKLSTSPYIIAAICFGPRNAGSMPAARSLPARI